MPITDMPPTLDQVQGQYIEQRIDGAQQRLLAEASSPVVLARTQSLLNQARSIGIKAGMNWELAVIKKGVQENERDLDTIYDFSNLMIKRLVVPPVITESRDLYNQDGDYAIRLSGAMYKIESQARFSSTPPNWRQYLVFPSVDTSKQQVPAGLMPKTSLEQGAWKEAIEEGWKDGIEQADHMMEHGFDELNRDFTGMLRFHKFMAQGKVSMPVVAYDDIPVTKNGNTMAVDEKLLRLTVIPDFNDDMSKWNGRLSVNTTAPYGQVPYYKVPNPKKRKGSVVTNADVLPFLMDSRFIKSHVGVTYKGK